MAPVGHAVANGIGSRLLSAVPGLIGVGLTVADHRTSGQMATLFPIWGAALFAVLGFIQPMLSTEGFWRSSEQRERLALAPKRVCVGMGVVIYLLVFGPILVRLMARLVGAL